MLSFSTYASLTILISEKPLLKKIYFYLHIQTPASTSMLPH